MRMLFLAVVLSSCARREQGVMCGKIVAVARYQNMDGSPAAYFAFEDSAGIIRQGKAEGIYAIGMTACSEVPR